MKLAALCVLVIGCQSADKPAPQPAAAPAVTATECTLFLKKARATIQEMGARANMKYTQAMEDTAIKDCAADVAAGKPMELARCVLDAKTEDAVHHCFPTYDQVTK